jgi:orotate phosphoribosyltransferase
MDVVATRDEFIAGLIRSGLLSFGALTTTAHGHRNPYYLDLRALPSHPALFAFAVQWCVEVYQADPFDYVCGIETASLPLAGAYGFAAARPVLYLRTKPKPYGKQKTIEGRFPPGARVCLLDDLIAEPGPSLEFIALAEGAGVTVAGLYVLYEKLAPAHSRQVFEARGYPVRSAFTYQHIANVIRDGPRAFGLELDPALAQVVEEFAHGSEA